MKNLKKIIAFAAVALLGAALTGCEGKNEDPNPVPPGSTPLLSADKTSIQADGEDAVRFTVTLDGADVTSEATIRCTTTGETLTDALFTTDKAGNYDFRAAVDGKESASISVKATAVEEPDFESKYLRHVAVMKFTGAHCAFCPGMSRYLKTMISLYYEETGNVHIMQLYDPQFEQPNEQPTELKLALKLTDEMAKAYHVGGFPSALVNQSDCIEDSGRSEIRTKTDAYIKEGPRCGVAVESALDEGKTKATVTVRLASEHTENFRLAVYAVEDNLIGYQNDGGKNIPQYNHSHVVRGIFSPGSYKGDDLGEVKAGDEVTKSYEIAFDTLESFWNSANEEERAKHIANTHVYVLALDADGVVNNMNVCAIDGGKADYDLVEK